MKKIKNILILAGGDSTRFWPLKNKILYSFIGKPLLQHVVESVKKYGEKTIVVTSETNRNSVKKMDPSLTVFIQKEQTKGMADAILSSKDFMAGDILILNANDIINFNILPQLVEKLIQHDLDLVFLARKVDRYFPGGYLKFENEKLSGIIEKPNPHETPSNLVNLVVDYFKDYSALVKILEGTQISADDSFERGLSEMISKGKVDYLAYDDYWYTIKYPWQVLPMMHHFLGSLYKEVRIGKNVKIGKYTRIEGPCFIDDNTIIGDYAMVRQSHIGKNCLIGGYTEVARSYLGDNVMLHRNYVGDSVLDSNVLMGAEATTANFRFDEKTISSFVSGAKIDTNLQKLGAIIGTHAKIGVNTTLLPGVKIGHNTLIAPGYTIAEDVEDEMFIFKKTKVKNRNSKNPQ